jgi:hypothetical protein
VAVKRQMVNQHVELLFWHLLVQTGENSINTFEKRVMIEIGARNRLHASYKPYCLVYRRKNINRQPYNNPSTKFLLLLISLIIVRTGNKAQNTFFARSFLNQTAFNN